ncbi:MAG TPA: extracellular solute-binding protein [Beijerinckiaceae bacterium]|nr:extracellular solute-binding protein [Beijerinckiaceae bacterium]
MLTLHRRQVVKGMLASGLLVPAGRILAQDRTAIEDGARKEGKLALATSVTVPDFPKFLAAFTRKYPFLEVTSGLYQAATGTVLARVDAELKSGTVSFDVMHIANPAAYLAWARQGLLQPYESPELTAYPPEAYNRGFWTTVRGVGVMLAYNKNILAAEKAPTGWRDLLKPEFNRKKLVIQNAASGTWLTAVYVLERALGLDYMKKLAAQSLILTSGSAQQIDMLNRGEALVAAGIDHTVLFTEATQRAGIVAVYPVEGVPLSASPVAILKGAPHPNAARLFVDYILSREGQQIFVSEVMKNYSLRKDMETLPGQKPLSDIKPLTPTDLADYEKFVASFPDHYNELFKS